MKSLKSAIALAMITALCSMFSLDGLAQHSKGFDYQAHAKMNKKASRWGKKRYKASDGQQINLKCSVRQSRRYARSQRQKG